MAILRVIWDTHYHLGNILYQSPFGHASATSQPSRGSQDRAIVGTAGTGPRDRIQPSQLRRAFQREYGLTPAEYQRRVRLWRVIEQLAETGGKIEPLSLEAGFRSKKNFYQAFSKLTGLTPTAFRALSPPRAQRIIRAARRALRQSG